MGDVVRSYAAGNFFLVLDGHKTGFLKSVDGGAATAEVIKEASGATYFEKKHLGPLKYEDITCQLGFSMTKGIYEWIAASWAMNYQRKNGEIVACDYTLEAKTSRTFRDALLTETTIPACDGASKEPGYMTVKFAPEATRVKKASGKPGGDSAAMDKAQKLWLPSNFKLEIDDLDCTKVSKVDSFSIKQTSKADEVGQDRDYQIEPGKLEFPNLKITLSEVTAEKWFQWHEHFVINGECDEGNEKGGRLVFLTPNRQTELAEVKFFNLGIFKIAQEKSEANNDGLKRVTAELYCERMEFKYLAHTVA